MRAYGLLIILCAFLPPASSAFQGISFWAKALPEFVRTLGGTATSNEVARSTAVDSQGNIYITGSYQNSSANGNSTTDFDDGTLLGLGGAPSADVFLAKLDPGGKQLWIRTLGGANSSDIGYSVAVDTSGNVYVAGTYINSTSNGTSAVDFAGNTLLGMSTLNNTDGFVAKLDSSGSQQWIRKLGGNSIDYGYGLAADASGNVYVTGVYLNSSGDSQTATDFAGATLLGKAAAQTYDTFVAKLNTSGTQQWIRTLGGTSQDNGYAVKIRLIMTHRRTKR